VLHIKKDMPLSKWHTVNYLPGKTVIGQHIKQCQQLLVWSPVQLATASLSLLFQPQWSRSTWWRTQWWPSHLWVCSWWRRNWRQQKNRFICCFVTAHSHEKNISFTAVTV